MLAASGMRRMMPRSGSTDIRPCPEAARSSSSMLVSTPAYRTRSGVADVAGAALPRMSRTRNGGARSVMPVGSGVPATTEHGARSRPARARAPRRWRAARRARGRVRRRCFPARASRRSGDSASASGMRMSSAMAAGRWRLIASTSSAVTVRGHGHWPIFARLFWSISTTVTGIDCGIRGARTLEGCRTRRPAGERSTPPRARSGRPARARMAMPTRRMRPDRRRSGPAAAVAFTTLFPCRRRPR